MILLFSNGINKISTTEIRVVCVFMISKHIKSFILVGHVNTRALFFIDILRYIHNDMNYNINHYINRYNSILTVLTFHLRVERFRMLC